MSAPRARAEVRDGVAEVLLAGVHLDMEQYAIFRSNLVDLVRGWRVEQTDRYLRDADGLEHDGYRLTAEPKQPTTTLITTTVCFSVQRDQTPAERERDQARAAAYVWREQDGPPPPGVSVNQLLDQRLWWVPKDAPPVRLSAMDPGHWGNLLAFLRRNAEGYKNREEWAMAGTAGFANGDAACDAFDSAFDQLMEQPASEWLEEKPLVRRLARLVARDERREALR